MFGSRDEVGDFEVTAITYTTGFGSTNENKQLLYFGGTTTSPTVTGDIGPAAAALSAGRAVLGRYSIKVSDSIEADADAKNELQHLLYFSDSTLSTVVSMTARKDANRLFVLMTDSS